MPANDAIQERRSEYDVTNTVDVSSPAAVRNAVTDLFGDMYPQAAIDPLWLAFHDFERMFSGADPEYHGVDTAYHDIQHTLADNANIIALRWLQRLVVDAETYEK